jgi:hypothetical protein
MESTDFQKAAGRDDEGRYFGDLPLKRLLLRVRCALFQVRKVIHTACGSTVIIAQHDPCSNQRRYSRSMTRSGDDPITRPAAVMPRP